MGEVVHRLDAGDIEANDIEDSVGEPADRVRADLDDDHDVRARRLGQALAETAAQIDDRHHDPAQIVNPADTVALLWQIGDIRPTLDLAHRHDVDAVLIVPDGKADELGGNRRGARRVGAGFGEPGCHSHLVGWDF